MRGRQAFFKQQAHRVALITKRRLNADQHIAKLFAQHKDRTAVAELAAWCRAPLGFNVLEPALAPHVVVGRNQGVDVGVSAVLRGVAVQQRIAQRVYAGRQVYCVALRLHTGQGVHQRLKHRQVRGGADVAGVGRKVEQHDGHFAFAARAALEGHQLGHARGQHGGALGAGMHVLRGVCGLEGAGVVAAGAGHTRRAGSSAKNHGAGGTIELWNGHHDGAFHRQQAPV